MADNRYTDNNLDKVASSCENIITWFDGVDDEKIKAQRNRLEIDLCNLINESKAAHEVLPVKTTLGVFGASQAGKSYLVSTLASFEGDDLTAEFDGGKISFFLHMNPTGSDTEATGIVTRFTKNAKSRNIKGFPFRVKVFTESDLVKILINSYFADLALKTDNIDYYSEQNAYLSDRKNIEALFMDLEKDEYALKDEINPVRDYDIISIAQYVQKKAEGCDLSDANKYPLDCELWTKARKIVSKLNFAGRSRLFSVLWNNNAPFTRIFSTIGRQLLELEGATEVYVPVNCFVDDPSLPYDRLTKRRGGTLIDIGAIKSILDVTNDDSQSVDVCIIDSSGEEKIRKILFPTLAFAASELSFPLPKESNADCFDVLDFPGCRSRKRDEVSKLGETGAKAADLTEYLRRGKVGYLFEQYCTRREIDVLLWCISVSKQQEVIDEQIDSISSWVNSNVGADETQRAKFAHSPLVGAFTRFDDCITLTIKDKQKDYDGIPKKLATALESFHRGWLDSWVQGEPFHDFFFVRKPNIPDSDRLYNLDDTGKELSLLDTENVKNQVEAYRERILACKEIKYVHKDPDGVARTVDEVLNPSDGGVNYLADYLRKTFDGYSDNKKHTVSRIKAMTEDLIKKLGMLCNRTGLDALNKLKAQAVDDIRSLVQCEKMAGTLSDFRQFIEIDKDKAREDYLANQADSKANGSYRFAKTLSQMREENISSICSGAFFEHMFANLKNSWTQKEQASVEAITDEQLRKSEYSFFINENDGQIIRNEKVLREKFASLLTRFTTELNKAYSVLGVEDAVVKKLEPYEKDLSTKGNLAEGQCMRALKLISDFNTYLYVDKLDSSEIEHFDRNDTDREFYRENIGYTSRNMCLVPNISSAMVENIESHYLNDYFSVLLNLICVKNLTAKSPYNVTPAQDEALASELLVIENSMTEE
ncbi:MAG: virulence factor SrfC family protein [Succinivibrio sp.]